MDGAGGALEELAAIRARLKRRARGSTTPSVLVLLRPRASLVNLSATGGFCRFMSSSVIYAEYFSGSEPGCELEWRSQWSRAAPTPDGCVLRACQSLLGDLSHEAAPTTSDRPIVRSSPGGEARGFVRLLQWGRAG